MKEFHQFKRPFTVNVYKMFVDDRQVIPNIETLCRTKINISTQSPGTCRHQHIARIISSGGDQGPWPGPGPRASGAHCIVQSGEKLPQPFTEQIFSWIDIIHCLMKTSWYLAPSYSGWRREDICGGHIINEWHSNLFQSAHLSFADPEMRNVYRLIVMNFFVYTTFT